MGGAQLEVDPTLVCPVRRTGTPQPGAATTDGTQLGTARTRKEVKYRELLASRRCRLVVLAIEVGGRWSEEAVRFIRLLAKAKARTHAVTPLPQVPAILFPSVPPPTEVRVPPPL